MLKASLSGFNRHTEEYVLDMNKTKSDKISIAYRRHDDDDDDDGVFCHRNTSCC